MWKTLSDHPIRAFAVLCVAVISGFIMFMRYWQIEILSGPDWCNRAMKAEQLAEKSRLDAALACIGLQKIQINAIALNSYIDGGTLALCLLTLIVIVVAGGRLALTASKTGISANISREEAAAAGAQAVAEAAENKSDEITKGAAVAAPLTPAAAPTAKKFTQPPAGEEPL